MTSDNEMLTDIDEPVFHLVWEDSRRYLQIMEIYAPNETQCFRLVEIMRAFAHSEGYSTSGVLVNRHAQPANDNWSYLTVKFPAHMKDNLELAFYVAAHTRQKFARALREQREQLDPHL